MTIIAPPHQPVQQFFRSGPLPCPYIPGQIERKLFTRLMGPQAPTVNSSLSRAGFRRSHDIVYRPVCPACTACVPVRVPVAAFTPDRTMRRLLSRNADLSATLQPAVATTEQFSLFRRYQAARHGDSDMSRMTRDDFDAMVEEGQVDTRMIEVRAADGSLCAALLADCLDDGLSAVYSFFDPHQPRRSLGTWLILQTIEMCRREGLAYAYLGYWIAGSRKMAYKIRFKPLEGLGRDGWTPLAVADRIGEPY